MVLPSAHVTMAAAYSVDLRERVAKAWDEKRSVERIGRLLDRDSTCPFSRPRSR
ncbi:MAG: hypothetical protein ACM3NF_07305 [Gemmatimonadota bacterium]